MTTEIKEVKSEITKDDLKAFEEEQGIKEEKTDEKVEEKAKKTEVIEPIATTSSAENLGDGLKDVPGETPKERAMRAEITRLRRANREKDQNNLIKLEPIIEDNDTDDELKNLGYDDEQIVGLKKVVDIIASKQGFVKKSANIKEQADATLNSFIAEHPEYLPENDKDDVYWGRFKELSSDYNLNGKTPAQLKSIFNKIDRDVKEELGEKGLPKEKIEAQKRKVDDISHGTSAPAKAITETKKAVLAGNKTFVSSAHPGLVFKGFDEEEMEDIIN